MNIWQNVYLSGNSFFFLFHSIEIQFSVLQGSHFERRVSWHDEILVQILFSFLFTSLVPINQNVKKILSIKKEILFFLEFVQF